MKKRVNWEQKALLPFEDVAKKHDLIPIKGQGNDNKIFLVGKANYQFGDLRVNTPTHHVVIEVESAGGVTNLVKYWHCLADNAPSTRISLPIILIHVFQQKSLHDYESHLKLWDFLWNEMQNGLRNNLIRAYKYPYHNLSELEPAIKEFEKSITPL